MNKYQIVQIATLHSGVLELSDAQYARRKHALKQIGKNKYEITKPVQFKVGETIGYEGDMPKAMADMMIDEAEAAAQKAAAKKPKQGKQAKEAEEKANAEAEALAAQKQAVQDEIDQLQIMLEAAADDEKAAIEDQIAAKQAELSAIE